MFELFEHHTEERVGVVRMKSFFEGEDSKRRIFALVFLLITAYLVSDMTNLLLLTFVFSYLLYSLTSWIVKTTRRWVNISERLVVLIVYGGIVGGLTLVGYLYIPVVINQVGGILDTLTKFNIADYQGSLPPKVFDAVQEANLESYMKQAAEYLLKTTKGVGTFFVSVFLSFLLSFFLLWEKKQIVEFLKPFKNGRVGFLYHYYEYFAKNFANTFGKMLQMQIIISIVNSLLSIVFLYFMGFDQVWGLGAMIFMLGLVPVAGVVLSLIPLSILAFKIGGIMKVVHVLIMVIVIHSVEAYVLNPKLVSSKMKLPVFISFAILIVAEHAFGVWGLLVGIPLFMFIMDLMKVPAEIHEGEKQKEEEIVQTP